MPNIAITNITSGEVSETMLGRPDQQRYANGCRVLENFLLATTGLYSFRPAFRFMGLPKAGQATIRLRRFQYSDQQGYMLELGDRFLRVWHTLGQVAQDGVPVEASTPFLAADLALLSFTQSADYLFVMHETRGLYAVKRRSHTDWVCELFPLQDGPYGKENVDAAKTLTLGGTSGSVTVQAIGHAPFGVGDEGRHIRVKDGSTWRWLVVTAITDSANVQATIQGSAALVGTGPFGAWRLGLYSSRLGWPACLSLHEQRLVLAGPPAIPDRIDGSAVAAFDNFAPGVNDGDAWAYALGTKNVNRILGLAVANDLIALTVGSEHRISGDSTGAAITPSQVWQKPISPDGAKRGIESIEVGPAIAFVDQLGLNIKALVFNLGLQSFAVDNLTLLSDHMCHLAEDSPGFQALAWQGNPIGTMWTIRGNGELAGCLYDPKENVLGWHRHPMGSAAGETPYVESIDTMKGPTHTELWAVVRRDLPSGTLRTIERMDRPGLWNAPPESQMFLDCGLSLRNAPAATLTPAATTGNGVAFTLGDVADGFAFTADHVGQFLKRRYLAGYTKRKRPIWKTAIARIAGVTSPTEVTADIRVAFPGDTAGAPLKLAAGQWGLTVSRITGLEHLDGIMVTAVSDGRVCAAKQVVNGAIDLDVPGWEVHAGLPYEGWMVSLPIDPGPSPAVGQGRLQRVDKIMGRLVNSLGGEFGAMPETDDESIRFDPIVPYKQGQAAPQASAQVFSGDKVFFPAGAWTRRAEVVVRQAQPLPCNVSLLVAHAYAPWVQP